MATIFKKIVVATDFSQEARVAALHGVRLARAGKGKLSLVHVLPESPSELAELTGAQYVQQYERERRQEAMRSLDELAASLADSPQGVRCQVLSGAPGKTLEAFLQKEKTTFLCMGAHGAGASRGKRVGTMAEYLSRHAPCSVLLLRPPQAEQFQKALLALQLDPTGAAALECAQELARAEGAALEAVHAFEFPGVGANVPGGLAEFERRYGEAEQKRVERFLADTGASALLPHTHVGEAKDVPQAIVARLAQVGAQLVILGTHRRGRLAHLFLGSVSAEVVRIAPVSVLVVRPPMGRTRGRSGRPSR